MESYPTSILAIIHHICNSHPELAEEIGIISARAIGKGFGSGEITKEIDAISQLSDTPLKLAIDIGGNIGDYTSELRSRYKDLEIHTFEPAAINYEKLKSRFAEDNLIHIINSAVADLNEISKLYTDFHGSGLASLTQRRLDHFNIKHNLVEEINVIRFEDYWNTKLNRRNIDVLKIDIEGNELKAFKGLGESLRSIHLVQFEFGGCNIDTRTFFQDFWYFFKDAKFEIYRITPHGAVKIEQYKETDEYFVATNYIAVNGSK